MDRVAIVAHLKDGVEQRAAGLVAKGPPFDPAEKGLAGHVVYLSASEVVFVFEGSGVEWILEELIDEPFQWPVSAALDEWRPLVEGVPRIARPAYVWQAA